MSTNHNATCRDPRTELTRSLLGRKADAVEIIVGKLPDEIVELSDNRKIFKYKEGDVKEIQLDTNGRVIRCGYTEERRAMYRVMPAHFIRVSVIIDGEDEYQGMIVDMSDTSMKIRSSQKPEFFEGRQVQLAFTIPEGTNSFPFVLKDATVYRIKLRDDIYQIVFRYPPLGGEENPYARYVRCRETESAFGKKWCEKNGGKCKNGIVP